MCFGDRVPNGEINGPEDRLLFLLFLPCGQDLRLLSPSTKSSSKSSALRENGEGLILTGSRGVRGGGGPSIPGVTVCSKQTAARTRRRGGCHAQCKQAPGALAPWLPFLQVGNGKPEFLPGPARLAVETERRVAPGPQWEDLGPPPQEAFTLSERKDAFWTRD